MGYCSSAAGTAEVMATSTTTVKKLLPTSLLAVSVLLCSVPAVANAAPDSRSVYLTSLNQHGVSYSDPNHMVSVGPRSDEAVGRIQGMGYSDEQAHVIAASAVLAFCPDMETDAK